MTNEETMHPFTNINNEVYLVTDSNHPRFGHIAEIVLNDRREEGRVFVRYGDKKIEEFHDSPRGNGTSAKGRIFYIVRNKVGDVHDQKINGPQELVKAFSELGVGDLSELSRRYKETFGQEF